MRNFSAAKRSIRRHHQQVAKERARFIGRVVWKIGVEFVTDRWVAQMAETHGRPCSCYLCSRRRSLNGPPISDLRRMDAN